MATATAKISSVYYAVSNFTKSSNSHLGFGEWNKSTSVYGGTGYYADGNQGPYYIWRSKIAIEIPDTVQEGANITGLTLKVKATQRCYPRFSCAVLTDKDIAKDDMSKLTEIGDVYINPSSPKVGDISVKTGLFERSEYYSVSFAKADESGNTDFKTAMDSGTEIYYKFTGDVVIPKDRILYIYLLRSGDGVYTSAGVSGWVASGQGHMSVSFTYETTKTVTFSGVLNFDGPSLERQRIDEYGSVKYSIDNGPFEEVVNFGDSIEVPYGKRLDVSVQSGYRVDEEIENRGGFIWIHTGSTSLATPSGVSSYTVESVTDSLDVRLDVRSVLLIKYDISNNKDEVEYLTDRSDDRYDSMIMFWPHGYEGQQSRPVAHMMPGWKLCGWRRDDGQLESNLEEITWSGLADCTYTPECERIGASIRYYVGQLSRTQKISAGESFVVGEYENWPMNHLMSDKISDYIGGWEFDHDGLSTHRIGDEVAAPTDVEENTVIQARPVYYRRVYDIYLYGSNTPTIQGVEYGEDISSRLPNSPPIGASLYKWTTDSGKDISWEDIAGEAVDTVDWSTMTPEDIAAWVSNNREPLPQQKNKVTLHPVYVSSCLPIVYKNGEPRMLAIKVWKNGQWNDCYMHCPVPKTN